ncbi:MAG: tetratricopeptide repeat protein, partial [Thermodesulfobacteriota bacterium]
MAVPAFANFELNLNKGIASFYKSEYSESIELLNLALAENPDNATANHIIGLSYYYLGNYEESIKYLEKAKKFDPELLNIDFDLATVYIKTDKYKKAIDVLNQFLSKNPDDGVGYYYLGFAQYSNGEYDDAIKSFDKAKSLNPDFSLQSNFYQGVCYYQLFDYENSRQKFLAVVNAKPGNKLEISAKEYLNILRTLGKKYYVNISAGYQYDTNVGLEPENIDIFTNEKDSSAFIYANLGYKPYFKNGDVIGVDYKTFFNFHDELKDFNIQNHTFSVYGEKSLKNYSKPINLFLDYSYQIVFIDGSPADNLFSQSHVVIPAVTVRWSDKVTSRFFYKFRYNDFEDLPERDAYNNSVTWAQFYNYYNGRLIVSPGLKMELNDANDIPGER